jgi:hypothetical protein
MEKMTTYTYKEKKISIDCRKNGVFLIWSLDNFGNRDNQPLYSVKDYLVKKYPNLADAFCDRWIKKNC